MGSADISASIRRHRRFVVQGSGRQANRRAAQANSPGPYCAMIARIATYAWLVRIVYTKNAMKFILPHSLSRLVITAFAAALVLVTGCHRGLPTPSTADYHEFISSFYVGLAALQVGDDVRADSSLAHAVQLAPGEPVAWADWGILALRQRNFDLAAERIGRARKLAPQNDRIYYLLGILGSNRGDSANAISNLREATKLNPSNLQAEYQLALEVERLGGQG